MLSILRNWDSRYKLICLLLGIVGIALYPPEKIWGVLCFLLLSGTIAFSASSSHLLRYVLPVLLVLVVFSAGPALFSITGISSRPVTAEILFGIGVAGKSLSIVMLVIGIGVTLTPSTVFKSLYWFKIPARVIFLLLVAYRYLQLFTEEVTHLHEARQLRLGDRNRLTGITGAVRLLIHRSFAHAESVYVAMRLRGGESTLPLLARLSATSRDLGKLLLFTVVFSLPYVGLLLT